MGSGNQELGGTSPEKPPRHHLLIAGTGRAGTSVLVRVLQACGLETEIARQGQDAFWDSNANAGLETIPLLGDGNPYLVKSPWSYQFLRELLAHPGIRLDGVIIPVRNLDEAAASRVILELRHHYQHSDAMSLLEDAWRDQAAVAGGVTYSLEPLDQARILAYSFHRMIEMLLEHDVPMHFIKFPRFVSDIEYLHRCLAPVLPHAMPFSEFSERMASVIDEGKVRVTGELAEAGCHTAPPPAGSVPPQDTVELPSFAALNEIALKRELRSARSALEALRVEHNRVIAQRDLIATELETIKGTGRLQKVSRKSAHKIKGGWSRLRLFW